MEAEDNHPLLQPLIPSITTTTTTNSAAAASSKAVDSSACQLVDNYKTPSNNPGIIFRLALIISIGIISIWANLEASKGFAITIINEAGRDTFPGKNFHLSYVSNDKASRIVFSTSKFVENYLYPTNDHNNNDPKKQVKHVILRLSSRNQTQNVIVESRKHQEFDIHISPSVMEEINHSHDAMVLAVQRGMAQIWLWDGEGKAPSNLFNAIVEFIIHLSMGSNFARNFGSAHEMEADVEDRGCWNSKNPKDVVKFLNYCELEKPGFIRRLNQGLKNGWSDQTLDVALGMPSQHICTDKAS